MDKLCPHLIILIVVENLFKFHTIQAKHIIFDSLILFTIKSAKFLFICGDVETNPGDTFDFCLWNCNSLPAHNFERISLIENYISIHKVKMFALTETALSSEIDDSAIEIPGFSILRNDLPGDHTHGGVLIYYKNDLSAKPRPDLQLHNNTLAIQINFGRKKVIIFLAYRKFGQNNDEFEFFLEKFEEMIENAKGENPHCLLLMGDFNAHLKSWYGEIDDIWGTKFQNLF